MSDDPPKPAPITRVHAFFDIMFKVGTPLGLALVAWLGSQFATKGEVDELKTKVSEIEKILAVMVETNRVNERQDKTLADHEDRLRRLENKG